MKLGCWVTVKDSGGRSYSRYSRDVVFPCFPYPGLIVGAFTVKSVEVCQGNLDGSGSISVQFRRVDRSHGNLLESQGWKLEYEGDYSQEA